MLQICRLEKSCTWDYSLGPWRWYLLLGSVLTILAVGGSQGRTPFIGLADLRINPTRMFVEHGIRDICNVRCILQFYARVADCPSALVNPPQELSLRRGPRKQALFHQRCGCVLWLDACGSLSKIPAMGFDPPPGHSRFLPPPAHQKPHPQFQLVGTLEHPFRILQQCMYKTPSFRVYQKEQTSLPSSEIEHIAE